MPRSFDIELVEFDKIEMYHGVPFPAGYKFRQFLIAGPPGSGKSTLIARLRGWPMEGYIDLTHPVWWRDKSLTYRPREVHLGLPYKGVEEALTVFDAHWLENWQTLRLEPRRILVPPPKQFWISVNWRQHYVFEFLLPPATNSIVWRGARADDPAFPTEQGLTVEMIERQNELHLEAALYMQNHGMLVYVREGYDQPPKRIVELTGQSG